MAVVQTSEVEATFEKLSELQHPENLYDKKYFKIRKNLSPRYSVERKGMV
jgi:hypothetical protein